MVTINVTEDCGNSPKNLLLNHLNIAFAEGDVAQLTTLLTDDLIWQQADRTETRGKTDFLDAAARHEIATLTLDAIISHGKHGAVNGVMTMNDGSRYAFCHVYTFKNTKGTHIKAITSYLIPGD